MDFQILSREAHRIAKEHGFHEAQAGPMRFPVMIALLHSELSEALEEFRVWVPEETNYYLPDAFVEEIADVFIRLADLVSFPEVGLDRFCDIAWKKMLKNSARPYRHGGKRI